MQSTKLYYANGALYAVFEEDSRTYYYEDGKLKTFEPYREGRLHGEATLYWPNGKMKRQSNFLNGIRHGSDRMWTSEGQIADEGNYEDGKPVGTHRLWNVKGILIEETEYLDSVRFNCRQWDELGKLHFEGVWMDTRFSEKVWDSFEKIWIEKQGRFDGEKLVYV